MTTTDNPLGTGFSAPADPQYDDLGAKLGDRRDGRVYVHTRPVQLAISVALATNRPLLLRGAAGSGKSSLAPFAARMLKRRFYWATVTARTEARDLMWSFDALKRLSDAQVQRGPKARARVSRVENYVEPRALWWAFEPASARRRGLPAGQTPDTGLVTDPGIGPRNADVVVLIDEIDKADPDVPNNLLEALGSLQFTVAETGRVVRAGKPPLVVITTNDERELPAAFYRRCVVHALPEHEPDQLVTIASTHFGGETVDPATDPGGTGLYRTVALELKRYAGEARQRRERPPSTAEFLDAVRACLKLTIDPATHADWQDVARLTLVKRTDPTP